MTGREQEEYSALRATIRERGTARICIFVAGVAAWAAVTIATAALASTPVAALLPLLLLASVFEDWGHQLSDDLPLSPRATATLVADMFHGIEIELLAGVGPVDAPHREVLDAFGDMIERAEKSG